MADLKITVEQLKNYLGTGLGVYHCDKIHTLDGLYGTDLYICHRTKRGNFLPTSGPLDSMKPICYGVSDIDKEIEVNGKRFIPADILFPKSDYERDFDRKVAIGSLKLQSAIGCSCTFFSIMQKLFEWHFWPFGEEYFHQGLVIDKLASPKTS